MSEYSYQGSELQLFQHAVNWKRYYASRIQRFITGDVLEVGAGLGATSRFLCTGDEASWTCLEPDPTLAQQLREHLAAEPLHPHTHVIVGTLDDAAPVAGFDTVLYIDVLEHIEHDRAEVARAARVLRPGGHLIVLSPAHNWLFSPFDRAIGHFRRYSRRSLTGVGNGELTLVRAFYLDSVGMLASLANRTVLKAQYPNTSQIRFWDSVLVPCSRTLDPILGYRIGKTVVAVWTRDASR
jgi:SAM-dependent methyltransferase